MSELGEVLTAYYEATGCDAAVWRREGADETPLRFVAGTRREDQGAWPRRAPLQKLTEMIMRLLS